MMKLRDVELAMMISNLDVYDIVTFQRVSKRWKASIRETVLPQIFRTFFKEESKLVSDQESQSKALIKLIQHGDFNFGRNNSPERHLSISFWKDNKKLDNIKLLDIDDDCL